MDQSTRRILGKAANQVLDLAEQMIGVGEKLNEAAGIETKAAWLAGAQKELTELIRSVEGPRA